MIEDIPTNNKNVGFAIMPRRAVQLCAALTSGLVVSNADASMGNLGTSYGLMPQDVATAQGLSLFNSAASAT